MTPDQQQLQQITRRHFFAGSGLNIGSLGLASLLAGQGLAAAEPASTSGTNPLAPRMPHFAAKAKRVIYLFMAGGPSQLGAVRLQTQAAGNGWAGHPTLLR